MACFQHLPYDIWKSHICVGWTFNKHAVVMFYLSGNFALQSRLLVCLAIQGVPRWAVYQWCKMFLAVRVCWLCWAFVVYHMAEFLGGLPGVTQKNKWNPCACQLHRFLCVCVSLNCVLWTKHNFVCLHDVLWTGWPGPTTMLPGSGVGVLPFTVNPVTPTGSTNCDTGTTILHYFLLTMILWHADTQ